MTRHIGRLTALFVKKHKTPGMFGDGGNLYLQITNANARSWIFRYGGGVSSKGKPLSRELGLGSAFNVTLEEARDAAYEYRKLLQQGIDPLDTRHARKALTRLEAAKAVTFAKCAEGYFQAHSPGWKPKYAALWSSSMAQHILPTSRRRQPGPMAWPSRQAPGGARQGAKGRASSGDAVRFYPGIHGPASST